MDQQRTRQPAPPLDPRAVVIMKRLAGEFADKFVEEFLLAHLAKTVGVEEPTKESVAMALEGPYGALTAFFGHYAFARRGKDREDLANLTKEALARLAAHTPMEKVLSMPDGTALWNEFDKLCNEKKRRSLEQQNRGPIQGMLELAQEIHRENPSLSLCTWVVDSLEDTGKLEAQHLRIVDIRGVGPKSASTFVRDMVWLYDMEDAVEPADRIFVQPVDRWLRLIVRYVVPEPGLEDPADWIVAGKIAKYSRRAGISGIAFNMGTTYFGQRVAHAPERFEDELRNLLLDEVEKLSEKSSGGPATGRPE